MHPISRFIVETATPSILNSVPRINLVAWKTGAQSYLEIGVFKGETFNGVEIPNKVGVDPLFCFDWQAAQNATTCLLEETSDDFFADLAAGGPMAQQIPWPGAKRAFDLIFIDGLHTFEQSYRDFENSLAWAHENTIWILDDTVPSNPYSAWPDTNFTLKLREYVGFKVMDGHGDVYKTLMAIHDNYPEFSYCTLMGLNPQTILWRAGPTGRKPAFSSVEEISRLSYFDIFTHAHLFMPVPDQDFPLLFGKVMNTEDYRGEDMWKRLAYLNIDKLCPTALDQQ